MKERRFSGIAGIIVDDFVEFSTLWRLLPGALAYLLLAALVGALSLALKLPLPASLPLAFLTATPVSAYYSLWVSDNPPPAISEPKLWSFTAQKRPQCRFWRVAPVATTVPRPPQ